MYYRGQEITDPGYFNQLFHSTLPLSLQKQNIDYFHRNEENKLHRSGYVDEDDVDAINGQVGSGVKSRKMLHYTATKVHRSQKGRTTRSSSRPPKTKRKKKIKRFSYRRRVNR